MRFYAVIQLGVPGNTVWSGRLAAAVASGATTVDFGQEMIPGYYVLIRSADQAGVANIEHLLIGSLVSGTLYNVTRDVLNETGTNPAWPMGTKYVAAATQDIEPPPYILDSLDITSTLRFGTQLHGGFSTASFSVSSRSDSVVLRLNQYLGAHVEIYDELGRVAWEGYVANTSIGETPNSLMVTCTGYYAKASDLFIDMIYLPNEATTNLIPNPSFENNITDGGWVVQSSGSGGSFTRSTAEYRYGSASARFLQPNASPDLTVYVYISAAANTDYVLSFWAKSNGSLTGGTPYVQVRDQAGTQYFSQQVSGLSTAWQRFEFPLIHTSASASQLRIYINVPNKSGTQGSMYVDAVQLEQKAYTTPYCDGAQSGCTWSGTAHNSASSRKAAPVRADQILVDCVNYMAGYWSNRTTLVRNDMYDIGPCDFSGKKVKDAIEYVMGFGTTINDEARATYFAVWAGRLCEVIIEPRPNYLYPDWFVSIDQVHRRKGTSLSYAEIYNRVYSSYSDGSNGPVPTVPSEDEFSIARYGLKEGLLQTGDVPFTATRSYFLQNAALEHYRYPRQIVTLEITGMIQRTIGTLEYPYLIRAGDTLVISDEDMLSSSIGGVAGQAANRYAAFVLKTEYDTQSDTVRVDIGSSDQSFDALMGRLGLSGGLS